MKIKMLDSYAGVYEYYRKDSIYDVPDEKAKRFIKNGKAEIPKVQK